jgi:hypothetical protein
MTWRPYSPTLGDAHRTLHSGLATEVLTGNLAHVAKMNAYDFCLGPPSCGAASWSRSSGGENWVELNFPRTAVWLRPAAGLGAPRSLTVEIRGWLGTADRTSTVRAVVVPSYADDPSAFRSGTYGSATLQATTPAVRAITIDTPGVGPSLPRGPLTGGHGYLSLWCLAGSEGMVTTHISHVRCTEGAP